MSQTSVFDEIFEIVKNWYGMALPLRILSREEQIQRFEKENEGLFPQWCWEYISKTTHLMVLWMNPHRCVDLVVRWNGVLKLVQDVEFRSAYPTEYAWRTAIKRLIDNSDEVWVVFHLD